MDNFSPFRRKKTNTTANAHKNYNNTQANTTTTTTAKTPISCQTNVAGKNLYLILF
jgi:hypothetical protein